MRIRGTYLGLAISVVWVNVLAFSASGADSPAPKVHLVSVPAGGEIMTAKVDSKGAIHLLYDSADGPQYVKSTDRGASWSAALPLVDEGSRKPGLEFRGSDMVLGKGGRVHVAMSTNAWKLKLPQNEWGLYYASLAPGAKVFSKVRNLNNKPSEGFSLAADDQGNVTACWLSDKLYANISHDEGKTFAPYVEISPSCNPCNCCTTSSTYGADGTLAVLYREETDNERDMYLVLWNQESNQVSRTRVSTTPWKIDGCPMTYYSIASTDRGFVVAWPTKEQVYFARLDGTGALLSPEEIKTPGNSAMRSGIVVLPAPSGSALVAWKKEGRMGWQAYDGQGKAVGPPGSARSGGKGVAGIVDKNGDFVLFP